ncbi:DUF2515 domain-containing protein [Halobacillus shinanisalinarum]|uniref:DUF2515 domain-containing protein n=1 Tax=Halobacillus shinanisalinarum TaxID=2932258 RepID=A0ABY4GXA4_9BACI|nr:DUF2515 domain-containing protein [Halobacillus shinanisalinarum]UOQ92694.1 DUF2515 domain-containing protein [Halobacillus shinanisalinarum]
MKVIKKQLKKAVSQRTVRDDLTPEEENIIQIIRAITRKQNQNNVTRTQAYFDFYQEHPEIHWALLAHLVSRNAGWNMTDLKGEYLPKLLSRKEQTDFFLFLERGNWLIFQDAYPQLLLYEESKKRGRPLFHLLSSMEVSKFMEPFWNQFWTESTKEELTIALIINEQQYIEGRVIQNKQYKDTVLNTIMFRLQDLFEFNHILLPYTDSVQKNTKLIGGTVHHFSSVKDRINLGKRLYSLLFSGQNRLTQTIEWTKSHPHTGSRKDFWPQLFNNVKETAPGQMHELQSTPCSLKHEAQRIYSPTLSATWKDWNHIDAESGDWYKNKKMIHFVKKPVKNWGGEIQESYCKSIEEMEIAASTKALFPKKDES